MLYEPLFTAPYVLDALTCNILLISNIDIKSRIQVLVIGSVFSLDHVSRMAPQHDFDMGQPSQQNRSESFIGLIYILDCGESRPFYKIIVVILRTLLTVASVAREPVIVISHQECTALFFVIDYKTSAPKKTHLSIPIKARFLFRHGIALLT